MLNKEQLLMGNTVGQQPVALTIGVFGRREFHYYGFDAGYFGTLAPVPFWGDNVRLGTLAYFEDEYRTRCAPTDRSCFFTVYISGYENTPIDTGETKEGDYYNFSAKVDQTVYLTFDPPRRVLGSKHTRTNLGRLEDPWEAQDAEQGTSDGEWCKGVVDYTVQVHRGLLYRFGPTEPRQTNHFSRTSGPWYFYGSSVSKEHSATFIQHWSVRHHKSRWVSSGIRGREQTRIKHYSASKRSATRATLRRVISKEALYA